MTKASDQHSPVATGDDDHHPHGLYLPVAVAGSGAVGKPLEKADLAALARNSESGPSGWYPVGAYQTWHNGIHLWASAGAAVHALCDGRMVAACLGAPADDAGEFGGRGFVLVRHTVTLAEKAHELDRRERGPLRNVTFFALYQHLQGLGRAGNAAPWLRGFQPFLARAHDGTFARLKIAKVGRRGPRSNGPFPFALRAKPTELRPQGAGRHSHAGPNWKPGEVIATLEEGTVLQILEAGPGPFQKVLVAEKGLEGWLPTGSADIAEIPDFGAQVRALRDGGVVELDQPVFAGEQLGHVGPIEAEHSAIDHPHAGAAIARFGLHLEIFSESLLVPGSGPAAKQWVVLSDDSDKDVMAELGPHVARLAEPDVLEVLKKLAFDTSPVDLAAPAARQRYFATVPGSTKAKLRKIVTRNTSYWAIDWSKLATNSAAWAERYKPTTKELEAADRYSWWKALAGRAKAMKLPKDALAYHYHPVAFLEYLLDHQLPAPIFYARLGGKIRIVEGVDMREHPWAPIGGDTIWVHEGEGNDSLLGAKTRYGQGGKAIHGWHRDGFARDLYDYLLAPPGERALPVPSSLTPVDRRIWSSIWSVEGDFESVNAYDTAFLSFGVIQKTAGAASPSGELQGALAEYRDVSPRVFKELFADRGLDLTEREGLFKAFGKVLRSKQEKERLRDFYWGYLFVQASHNDEFVVKYMDVCLSRLAKVRARRLPGRAGGEGREERGKTFAELFPSELAQALVLDADINAPYVGKTMWPPAVRAAEKARVEESPYVEAEMLARLVYERLISILHDPFSRTGKLLAATKSIDVGYESFLRKRIRHLQQTVPLEAKEWADEAGDQAKATEDKIKDLHTALRASAASRPGVPAAARLAELMRLQTELKATESLLKKQRQDEKDLKKYAARCKKHEGSPLWAKLETDLKAARKQAQSRHREPFMNRPDLPAVDHEKPPSDDDDDDDK